MILVVCGPSGVGKTTLVRQVMARHRDELAFSISHTTRQPRGSEQNGVDYHFVDEPTFETMVAAGEFAEHARVHGRCYGTSKAALRAIEDRDQHPVLDIDYQGAEQMRAGYPAAVTVLVVPPSLNALEARLRGRRSDSEEQVLRRLAKAKLELSQYAAFEYIVVNDEVGEAAERLDAIVLAELSRTTRNEAFLAELLADA